MSIKALDMHQQTGADGVMHLTIPTGEADCRYRVIVLLESQGGPAKKSWPPGFLDQLVGSWTAEYVEAQEGPYEERESF